MASLDPHVDYAVSCGALDVYYVNDFLLDSIYAITFPRFIAPLRGSQAVLRRAPGRSTPTGQAESNDPRVTCFMWLVGREPEDPARDSVEPLTTSTVTGLGISRTATFNPGYIYYLAVLREPP